ncbi:MAG: hypothetical protein IJO03_09670 [Clostridia bacterium]|nr:hypothetical protein [Clostridia bacterium]
MSDFKEILTEILKMLAMISPFVLICALNNKSNLPQINRSRQFLMPPVALVIMVAVMFFTDDINRILINFIRFIPNIFIWVDSLSWIPEIIGDLFYQIGVKLRAFFDSLNLSFWIFFISNWVILALYVIIKKSVLSILSGLFNTDNEPYHKLYDVVAGEFYEFFPEREKWCVKNAYSHTRKLLKALYISSVVISVAVMLLSRKFYDDKIFTAMFYPVFGVVIVGELYFFLDGLTKREYTQNILGEDENAHKTVNYSLLRKFLRNLFKDKLLSESTNVNNALADEMTTTDIIRNLEKDEDPKVVTFATYMEALNRTGFEIDNNYLYSSLDLLKGKSILFNNPFYNDHIPYAFYPMNRALLTHKKVLVILGRHAIEDDIREWIEKGIESVTNIPFMWKIGVLGDEQQDVDIGIITRSDVLNIKLHEANADFLEKVEYCVIIEPSKLISTAQIGLNLIVKKCRNKGDRNIVFCMFDKNCDGLVDAMSHILMTSISEVAATPKHLGTSSYMSWEADDEYVHHRMFPNISRYLGMGTELSFAGLKNQVSRTTWFGGEAFPVTDMNWIDRQYYYELMKYAGLPTNQESMDERFKTTPNYWSATVAKNNYFTVEDESFNMFEILREFETRSTEQGFINVISSDYLLKDYMADNASIFEADPKAIPYIVADYARTDRNVILRLVLMMCTLPVAEEEIIKELSLIGIKVYDLKKQLWHEIYKCYADTKSISSLSSDYKQAVEETFTRSLDIESAAEAVFTSKILNCKERYNMRSGKMETVYSIVDPVFISVCAAELRSAGYVAEDEKGEKYYLGSELSGHIYQKYLPGQFFTFGGKYYEMQYLTADGQVLVRRAADHIHGRPAYRQIREYEISGTRPITKIGASRSIAGMKVVREYADIRVKTPGYHLMDRYNNFESAKEILFEESSGIPERVYKNKEILRIELPGENGGLADDVRYTVAVLFNELFKTLFADNQHFITAVTNADHIEEGVNKPLTASVIGGDGFDVSRNSIYIIEDSQLDLGLTVAVERNLKRIFRIIQDYLSWHAKTLDESLNPPPAPKPYIPPEEPEETQEGEDNKKGKKKGFFKRIIDAIAKPFRKIKEWFKKRKKKKKGEPQDEAVPETENGEVTEMQEESEVKASVTPKIRLNISYSGIDSSDEDEQGNAEIEAPEEIEKVPEETEEAPEGIVEAPAEIEEASEEIEEAPEEIVEAPEEIVEAPEEIEEAPEEIVEVPEEIEEAPEEIEAIPEFAEVIPETEEEGFDAPYPVEEDPEETVDSYGFEGEEAVHKNPAEPFERKKYHERHYLLFGGENDSPCINAAATLDYLTSLGFDKSNPLKQARDGKNIAAQIEATYNPDRSGIRLCDFCYCEILGVEYETLVDGRDRCMSCGRTAIKTEEEFKAVFEDVKRNLESFFNIKINAGVRVEMVNSKTLHKRIGRSFVPTNNGDGRVLGVAISDKNGFSLLVENGSPRVASMLTMAHELTHIWQYINWNEKELANKYDKATLDEVYEGMAKWVEIQYAYLINEPAYAKREEIRTAKRKDEYGRGFLRFTEVYPFSTGTVITGPTPFLNTHDPLDPNISQRENEDTAAQADKTGKKNKKSKKKGGKKDRTAGRSKRNKDSKGSIIKGIILLLIVVILLGFFVTKFNEAMPSAMTTTGSTTAASAVTQQSP